MYLESKGCFVYSGTIGKDPEKRVVESGEKTFQLINLGLIVGQEKDDKGENKSIWKNLKCWSKVALVANTLKKGDIILCSGVLENKTYTGKDGAEHSSLQGRVDFIVKMNVPQGTSNATNTVSETTAVQDLQPVDDDDLPF